jgi:hypothetical protein
MKYKTTNHNTQIDNGVRHNFAYVSGPFLCGGGFFISVQKIKSTLLQCQMATRMIWSCSSRSQEPSKENGTQNGRPELPKMIQQRLLLKSFSASKWLWLGFSSALFYSECPLLWPQTCLGYIDGKLVSHLQLPLKI